VVCQTFLFIEIEAATRIVLGNVNSLKAVSARLLRRDFGQHLAKFYWKPVLWSRSYFVASCGGAPLEVINQYIKQQAEPC
jgi:putative transposase